MRTRARLSTALIMAVLAGGALSGPASAASTDLEGEAFALPAAAGTVVPDGTASGGRDLLVWTNATATGSVSLAGASTRLTVRALGDQCQGPPVMSIAVDGKWIGRRTVSATTWTTYVFGGTWAAGPHQVAVSYTNDLAGGTCDRNLRLDKVGFRTGTVVTPPPPPPPPPPPASRAFGLSQDGAGRGIDAALSTATAVGHRLDEINFYASWYWDTDFPTADVQRIDAAGALPSITWEPWQPGAGAWQPGYSLASIVSGGWDAYIDRWAASAAAYGRPVRLRFAHEMNGGWYPWSPSVNGGSPTQYVAAWRRVHDRFVAAGATNVSWVWSMNVVDGMPTTLDQVYPGDGYVDAVGVDGYNWGNDPGGPGGWKSPSDVFGATLAQLAVVAPGKPVYVAETGSSANGGNKEAWVRDLFGYLATTPVRGVDWFEFGGTPDWRLNVAPDALAAARTALATW